MAKSLIGESACYVIDFQCLTIFISHTVFYDSFSEKSLPHGHHLLSGAGSSGLTDDPIHKTLSATALLISIHVNLKNCKTIMKMASKAIVLTK